MSVLDHPYEIGMIVFPPIHSNWDGDAYDDYEEFNKKGTSPYIYNMTGAEYLNCFLSGVLWGDTIREVDNVATLAGQIVGGFCPISDLRDYFANGYYGDFGTALLNLFAMIPAMGDAASIANRVGKFIVNHTYDIAKMTEVLLFAAKNCPDVFKYLGKQDEILSYVKYLKAQKTLPITRMGATDVNNVLESLGCTDDLIKYGDDVGVRPAILDDVAEGGSKIVANARIEKFSEYIFKDGATHGKNIVFENLGYSKADSEYLADLYIEQANAK
ncbi:MAG: hypothetical protein IJW37_06055 [Lachnospiraceae bacterium]|nr:hypothetical protein [Lachnospiraceae bacterium]